MIEAPALDEVMRRVGATPAVASKALASTLRKLARWLRSRSVRGLSQELALQQKVLRRRMASTRLRRHANGASISLWYGLNPIDVIHLNARQSRRGVRAYGGRQIDSGFIATGRRGREQVFRRKGWARLPIECQRVAIEREALTYIRGDLVDADEFRGRFLRTFEHELTWRMRKQ